MDYNENITNNFKWKEFFKSYTATRNNIYNYTTNELILHNIRNLTENVLQPLRDIFGSIRILSGFRCDELNKKVHGSPSSNHKLGQAVDIEPYDTNTKLIDILTFINKRLDHRELIAEYLPNGWIHVAYRKGCNDRILKLKDKNHNYSQVSLEYIQELYEI